MEKNNFRVLFIPHGQEVDHEGRDEASDWLVADLFDDEDGHYYITTNSVNCSNYDFVLDTHSARPKDLAEAIVKMLNSK